MMSNNEQIENIPLLIDRISQIVEKSKKTIVRSLNQTMLETYWQIGKEIIQEEQKGQHRAEYGKEIIKNLSSHLSNVYGKGYDARNLWFMRQFYLVYPNMNALRSQLSWTHYRILMRIDDASKRSFYELECTSNNWSTRELERQKNSLLFERLALSKDKDGILALAREGQVISTPEDIVKDPYVLEFLGLPENEKLQEKELESALLKHLQQFLLELGKGFSFVARQKRITLDGAHFYIDLVFYNYLLKCFVLIDLKMGELAHQDIGQMQMYVNYYQRELKPENDNNPVGIILCADKKDTVVKYTLPEDNQQIFASRYQLYLPTEEELRQEIIKETQFLQVHSGLKMSENNDDKVWME